MASQASRAAARQARLNAQDELTDETDLNNAQVQEKIMFPEPKEIKLSFQSFKIYPMSAKKTRQFHGFATSVAAAAIQEKNTVAGDREAANGLVSTMFLNAVISRSEKLTNELLHFLVCSTDIPGKITGIQEELLVKEIDEKITSEDLLFAFSVLCEISGFTRSLKIPVKKD